MLLIVTNHDTNHSIGALSQITRMRSILKPLVLGPAIDWSSVAARHRSSLKRGH